MNFEMNFPEINPKFGKNWGGITAIGRFVTGALKKGCVSVTMS